MNLFGTACQRSLLVSVRSLGLAAAALLCLASCKSGGPVTGPYAYVRFIDNRGEPGAATTVVPSLIYAWLSHPSATSECDRTQLVPNGGAWQPVAAGREFGAKSDWQAVGSATGSCSVPFAGRLKEGQRVTYRFEVVATGVRDVQCRVVASDESGAELARGSAEFHDKPSTCKFMTW
ncbi:hypothetical protein [Cognatilysobacter lacus]|uniref:Uncharacterized protein n=1 Tax=Cognatilysobacter lacus TaxID=1643323 RepID=A0A5D8Z7K0_9GAMM|nr:hypothetical protein [Lysobacter lacus]TZF90779.1 hypothetical protein FW784_04015 [Lysobacter lacus]